MKRDDLVKSIVITRFDDPDGVSFEAFCPYGCNHTDFSVVHYGNKAEAKSATISKMVSHCMREHDVVLDKGDVA